MTQVDTSSDSIEFDDKDEAIAYAIENGAYEVEEIYWYSYEDYNNYQPADGYTSVWKKTYI